MSVIILGDPHIGKSTSVGKNGIGSALNSRIVDQINLLNWTLDQAIETHSNHIIITGDIFEDPKPTPNLITLFISWLKKCQINNIHTHIIMGNHDIVRSGSIHSSPLDIIDEMELDHITVYKNITTIFIDTSAFTIIPFRDRKFYGTSSNSEALSTLKESLIYELSSIPITYQKFVVGHLAIEGSIPIGDEIDDLSNELFCPIDMFTGYDAVWMGHVHKPQIIRKYPYIAHVGSMDISNFGEVDHKKNIIIVDTTTLQWETKILPTRSFKSISIVVPPDSDNLAYITQELDKYQDLDNSTVRVEIALPENSQSISKSEVEKYLLSKNVFNIAGISQSKKAATVKKNVNNNITTKMDVPIAINTYAKNHIPDDMRDSFVELSISIYNQFKSDK